MSNPQLQEIEASPQSIVRRAYELGQSDALKKVVDAVGAATQPAPEPIALAAPDAAFMKPETAGTKVPSTRAPKPPDPPWWIRPFK